MKLAEKIREMQGKKDPIDTEWLKDAIVEYFQVRTTREMFIGLNYGIKEPQRKAISKTAYNYDIPKRGRCVYYNGLRKKGSRPPAATET